MRQEGVRARVIALELGPSERLVQLDERDADELYLRVASERARLAEWLPWAESSTLPATRAFCRDSAERCAAGEGFDLGVRLRERLVGVVGANSFDALNGTMSLGYWLSAEAEGRGLMTRACAAVVDHAFRAMGLHRVEVRVAPGNARSLAIVRRLGAREEGRAREAALLRGTRHDLLVFGILAHEWQGTSREPPKGS